MRRHVARFFHAIPLHLGVVCDSETDFADLAGESKFAGIPRKILK
jgi:hypothetical protein